MRNPHVQIHLFARRIEIDDCRGGVAVARWGAQPLIVEHDRVLHLDGDARACEPAVACFAIQVMPSTVLATPRIAVKTLRGHQLLVNGQRAPSLASARAGDEITPQGHERPWRLHVSVYRPAMIGAAREDLSGRECPLCLGRFSGEMRVFRCGCGSALHIADTPGAAGELDCARAVEHCPDCRRAIVLTSGYEELPDDDNGRAILPRDRAEATTSV
jgi:hypothetical protein